MLTVCYINRQPGIEGITIQTQMLAARAPQAKKIMLRQFPCSMIMTGHMLHLLMNALLLET